MLTCIFREIAENVINTRQTSRWFCEKIMHIEGIENFYKSFSTFRRLEIIYMKIAWNNHSISAETLTTILQELIQNIDKHINIRWCRCVNLKNGTVQFGWSYCSYYNISLNISIWEMFNRLEFKVIFDENNNFTIPWWHATKRLAITYPGIFILSMISDHNQCSVRQAMSKFCSSNI